MPSSGGRMRTPIAKSPPGRSWSSDGQISIVASDRSLAGRPLHDERQDASQRRATPSRRVRCAPEGGGRERREPPAARARPTAPPARSARRRLPIHPLARRPNTSAQPGAAPAPAWTYRVVATANTSPLYRHDRHADERGNQASERHVHGFGDKDRSRDRPNPSNTGDRGARDRRAGSDCHQQGGGREQHR